MPKHKPSLASGPPVKKLCFVMILIDKLLRIDERQKVCHYCSTEVWQNKARLRLINMGGNPLSHINKCFICF